MTPKTKTGFLKKHAPKGKLVIGALGLLAILATALLAFELYHADKIYPGVFVAGVSGACLTPEQLLQKIQSDIKKPEKLGLVNEDQNYEIPLSAIDFSYDFEKSVEAAYMLPRTGNPFHDLPRRLTLLFKPTNVGLRVNLDEEKLAKNLSVIAGQVATDPVYPSVSLEADKVVVNRGKTGSILDESALRLRIGSDLAFARADQIVLPLIKIDPTLGDEAAQKLEGRAVNLKDKALEITFEYETVAFRKNDLLGLLSAQGYNQKNIDLEVEKIANKLNRPAQNPIFVFEEGRVKEFTPSRDGIRVKKDELGALMADNLKRLEETEDKLAKVEVPTQNTPPEYSTDDVNNMGIKELIGRGTSRFAHSIPSRIYNVGLAASKFNGVLVKPGETMSFNATLGDVSKFTGYKEAYIIKDGRTVLGDGGGVCQVSTTFFRAAMKAGLPIIERRAHAYRVGYYEQDSAPGLDATVYDPSPDLKIKNDTPGHILIQTIFNPKAASLAFEIYGTSDGRVATTTRPVVTDQVAPPPDLYQDDPTLPAGTVKQVDYKAWGAKATFTYTVKRDGASIYQKTFVSNYRPWQAVFLRGTGPAQ